MWSTNAKHLARLIMTTVVTTCSRRNLGKSRWRCEAVERLLLAGSGRSLHSHLALIKQRRFLSTNWSGFLCVFLLCAFKRAVCESWKYEIETILHQAMTLQAIIRWKSCSVTITLVSFRHGHQALNAPVVPDTSSAAQPDSSFSFSCHNPGTGSLAPSSKFPYFLFNRASARVFL